MEGASPAPTLGERVMEATLFRWGCQVTLNRTDRAFFPARVCACAVTCPDGAPAGPAPVP